MRNKETLELVTNAAKSKIGLLKEGKGKYFLSAFLAGMLNFIDFHSRRS